MICPKCGAQISDDAKFCGVCGSPTAPANADQTPPQQPTPDNTPAPEAADTVNTDQTDSAASNQYSYQPSGSSDYNAGFQQQADNSSFNNNSQQPSGDTGFNSSYQQQGQPNSNYQQGQPNGGFNNGYQQGKANGGGLGSAVQQLKNSGSNKLPLLIIGGIAVVAIILLIVIFNLIFGSNYKTPIKDTVKFLNKQSTDIEDYCEMAYGKPYGQYMYERLKLIADIEDEDDWKDDAVDFLESKYDDFEDEYGDDWKISYEFREPKQLSKSQLRSYQDDWEDMADSIEDQIDYLDYNDDYSDDDIDDLTDFYKDWSKKLGKMKVTDGYTVKVRLTIEGDDGRDRNTKEITVLKIDGEWVWWNNTLF